ncbi:MAG TPA: DUF4914 family protein, partial [Lacipirellulaceae bacterium]|nr:DUF4914 family protein [Lacipirellulaceae bacterium]
MPATRTAQPPHSTSGPDWRRFQLPADVQELLSSARSVWWAPSKQALLDAACGGPDSNQFEVSYDIPGQGPYVEAVVNRVRNGVAANYTDPYMRRRDPDCMFIADDEPTDKKRFRDKFQYDFGDLRNETFEWLKGQDLVAFGFDAGSAKLGVEALVVAPA